jgi:hypothetical protein
MEKFEAEGVERAVAAFRNAFGVDAEITAAVAAPGRVNLIGRLTRSAWSVVSLPARSVAHSAIFVRFLPILAVQASTWTTTMGLCSPWLWK